MRIRTVKPEFWRDVKLHGLPIEVRLTFIGFWNVADDSGYFRWEPAQIAMDLYPDLDGKARVALVNLASRLLVRRGRLVRLDCGHAVVPHLPRHQHLAGATKQVHTFKREHDLGRCPRVPAGPRAGKVRLGEDRKGKDNTEKDLPDARAGGSLAETIGWTPPDEWQTQDRKH